MKLFMYCYSHRGMFKVILHRSLLCNFNYKVKCCQFLIFSSEKTFPLPSSDVISLFGPFPPPGDLPDPGIKPASLASALAGGFFTTAPPEDPVYACQS